MVEQDTLTREGWKLLFDFGMLVSFLLFVNDMESIPVEGVWFKGRPKHFLIHPTTYEANPPLCSACFAHSLTSFLIAILLAPFPVSVTCG